MCQRKLPSISFPSFQQKLACSPEVCKDDMKHTLEQAMKRNGLETEIRNIVFHLIRTSIKNEVKLSMQTVSLLVRSSDFH